MVRHVRPSREVAQELRSGAVQLAIHHVDEGPHDDGFQPVRLNTSRGGVHLRWFAPGDAVKAHDAAVVWLAGAGGGWGSPAQDVYGKLTETMGHMGIGCIRVMFRDPRDLVESTLDALAGAAWLQTRGVKSIAFVGHSFGGAVAIQAAAHHPAARTVMTLATQSYGADAAGRLPYGCSMLLLHGLRDSVLPPSCSRYVETMSPNRAKLVLYPDANHGLDEVADRVESEMRDWLVLELLEPARAG